MCRQIKKLISIFVLAAFLSGSLKTSVYADAQAVILPAPGTMISLSPAYEPVLIKGLTVHKDNPFLFDFVVDTGHSKLGANNPQLKEEADRLIKYFFACLTIPEKDLWVNLSPYEKDRMLPEALGQTALGRDLLAEDYILKQLTASLIYPEKDLGKEFWNKVYTKAQQMYGTTQVPVNTFNKVWILADKATVYEHGQTAFVVGGHLKVMLEEDYLAMNKQMPTRGHHEMMSPSTLPSETALNVKAPQGTKGTTNEVNQIGSKIVRDVILPEIEREVNTGKNFATLRQIFNSLILASWYKQNLKEALLNQVYSDKSTVKGVNLDDPAVKEQIFQQYLKAYKKGVFNYIKEDKEADGQTIPRKYFSGGFGKNPAMLSVTQDSAMGSKASQPTGLTFVTFQVAATTNRNAAMSVKKPTTEVYTTEGILGRLKQMSRLENRALKQWIAASSGRFTYAYVSGKPIQAQWKNQNAVFIDLNGNILSWADIEKFGTTYGTHVIFDTTTQSSRVIVVADTAQASLVQQDSVKQARKDMAQASQLDPAMSQRWAPVDMEQPNSHREQFSAGENRNKISINYGSPNAFAGTIVMRGLRGAPDLETLEISLKRTGKIKVGKAEIFNLTLTQNTPVTFYIDMNGQGHGDSRGLEEYVRIKAQLNMKGELIVSEVENRASVQISLSDSAMTVEDEFTLRSNLNEKTVMVVEPDEMLRGQIVEELKRLGVKEENIQTAQDFSSFIGTAGAMEKMDIMIINRNSSGMARDADFIDFMPVGAKPIMVSWNETSDPQPITAEELMLKLKDQISNKEKPDLGAQIAALRVDIEKKHAETFSAKAILIVEKDPAIADLIEQTLRPLGAIKFMRASSVGEVSSIRNLGLVNGIITSHADIEGLKKQLDAQLPIAVVETPDEMTQEQIPLLVYTAIVSLGDLMLSKEMLLKEKIFAEWRTYIGQHVKGKVLLVLDDEGGEDSENSLANVLKKELEGYGAKKVLVAYNVADALRQLREQKTEGQDVQGIITDVDMEVWESGKKVMVKGESVKQELQGTDFVRQVLEEFGRTIPIVAWSGHLANHEPAFRQFKVPILSKPSKRTEVLHNLAVQIAATELVTGKTELEQEAKHLIFSLAHMLFGNSLEESWDFLNGSEFSQWRMEARAEVSSIDRISQALSDKVFSDPIAVFEEGGALKPQSFLAKQEIIDRLSLAKQVRWKEINLFKRDQEGSVIKFAILEMDGFPWFFIFNEDTPAEPDGDVGGIDLNTANMGMTIQKDAQGGVKVSFDPAMLERIKREGIQSVVPVIINMTPVSDIRPLLGLTSPA